MEVLTTLASAAAAEAIKKLAENMSSFVTQKVSEYYTDITNKELIDSGWAFVEYLNKVYDEYSYSKSIIYMNEPVKLSKFFVPVDLKFERKIPIGRTVNLLKSGDHRISGKNVEEVLGRSNKIIITGIGGLGKTMHMKHFCVDAIEKEYKIPIFIQLRWFNERDLGDKPLENLIYEKLVDFGFSIKQNYFFESLVSNKYLFLFDGLDEVSKDKRAQISVLIESFTQHYSENSYIISSRKIDDVYSFGGFIIYSLCKLEYEQVVKLIWKLDFPDEKKKRFIDELNNGLYKEYTAFVSVPLLLSLLFITYLDNTRIPETLQEFYEISFLTMMYRHDNLKLGFIRKFETGLSYTDFKKVFTRFCFITYFNEVYSFSEHSLIENIEVVANAISIKLDVHAFKRDLVDITCMLIQDGLEYTFIHRNFQEYFAAKYVSEKGEEEQSQFCSDFIYEETEAISEIKGEGAVDPIRDKTLDFLDVLYSINPNRFETVVLKPILEKVYKAYEECGNDIISLVGRFFHVRYERYPNSDTIAYYVYFKCPFGEDRVYQFNSEEYNVLCYFYRILYLDERTHLEKDMYEQIRRNYKALTHIFDGTDNVEYIHIRTEYEYIHDLSSKVVSALLILFKVILKKYEDLQKKGIENSTKVVFKKKIVSF